IITDPFLQFGMKGMRYLGKFRNVHFDTLMGCPAKVTQPFYKRSFCLLIIGNQGKILSTQVSTSTRESRFLIPIFFSVINPSAYFTPIRLPSILALAITLSRKSGVDI